MVGRLILAVLCMVLATRTAEAQDPYNLTAPVTNLATIFTDLFGPRGLIVDSLATLPGEQPHIAHFTSDFQFNFSQFSTALVSQLVSVPLPSPGGGFTYRVRSVARRVPAHDAELRPDPRRPRRDDRRPARVVGLRAAALHLRHRSRASTCSACPRSSRTTTRNCSAAARTWSRRSNAIKADVNQSTDVRHAGRHRPLRPVAGGADRRDRSQDRLRRAHPAARHHQRAHALLPSVGRRASASSGSSPRSAAPAGSATSWCG